MSMATVKGGQTNPSEVVKYLRRGVQVFNCSNLHAKVYVFDNAVIIGSANVSKHSAESLVEAGLLCTDRQAVTQARGFVRSLQVEPVSLKYARQCQRIYKPPAHGVARGKHHRLASTPSHSRLWLVSVHPAEFTDQEDALCSREHKKAAKKLKNTREYEVNSIKWCNPGSGLAKEVKFGDLFVQVWSENGTTSIYPPARVLRTTPYRSFDRSHRPRLLIHIEEKKNPNAVSVQRFLKTTRPFGLTRRQQLRTREVRSAEMAHAILGLWR